MPSDNYICPFVVIMAPGNVDGTAHHAKAVVIVKSMNMGPRTIGQWPIWPVKVSHRVPVEWLGNCMVRKNRYRTLVRGYCGCSGEVKDRK